MAKKKEMDNLAKDAAAALAAGMSYGKWKAMQSRPVVIVPKVDELPDGWKVCPFCGNRFKPNKYGNGRQVYCEVSCQKAAQQARRREKNRERQYRYRERKKVQYG